MHRMRARGPYSNRERHMWDNLIYITYECPLCRIQYVTAIKGNKI